MSDSMHPRQQPALAAPPVMASSLLSHHAGGSVHVRSAGTAPAAAVDPHVIQVLAEVGIEDPEGKSLTRVRAIRDDVDAHFRALMADLATPPV